MNPEMIFPMIAIIVLYIFGQKVVIPAHEKLFVKLWLKIFNRKK